ERAAHGQILGSRSGFARGVGDQTTRPHRRETTWVSACGLIPHPRGVVEGPGGGRRERRERRSARKRGGKHAVTTALCGDEGDSGKAKAGAERRGGVRSV